jgi:hypothetical protein
MNPSAVLIAAGFDWLEGLLPLLFVLYWIGSQLVGLFRAAGGGRKPVAQVPAPRPPAGPPDDAAEARGELERQIEEFLRQPGGRTGRRAGGREAAGREAIRPQRPARSIPPAASPTRQKAPSADITGRHLGALEAAGGPDVAKHVHDAFAHDLGRLTTALTNEQSQVGTPPAAAPAVNLVALLRSPAALRQLFLVREVLDRPVERW